VARLYPQTLSWKAIGCSLRNVQMEEQNLEDDEGEPTVSIIYLEARTGICHAFLHRTLQKSRIA
jgi:hypothetical protein